MADFTDLLFVRQKELETQDRALQDAYRQGYDDGYEAGYEAGLDTGYAVAGPI